MEAQFLVYGTAVTSVVQLAMAFSQAEVDYCILNVQHGIRLDGRAAMELRPIELSLGPIAQASGSARLRLGATDVIVGVKAEVGSANKAHPSCGRLQITVECSACASPEYEGRGGQSWGNQLASALQDAILPPAHGVQGPAAPLIQGLGIIPGKAAWNVYVDALVLNDAGGVLCALSLATLAALRATRLPRITVTQSGEGGGEGEAEIELEDDGGEGVPLTGLESLPVCITLAAVGKGAGLLLDPGLLEERSATAMLHVAVDRKGAVCGVQLEGAAGLPPADVLAMTDAAAGLGPKILTSLSSYVTTHQQNMDTE